MSVPEKHTGGPEWGWVVFLTIFALAVVGVWVGTGNARPLNAQAAPVLNEAIGDVISAPRWIDARRGSLGPNTIWKTSLSMVGNQSAALLQEPSEQTAAQKEAALQLRANRRAYAGAPPRTPHSVTGMSVYACQACHGNGVSQYETRAPAPQMPHALYLNCLQCHETMEAQPPGGPPTEREAALVGNTFLGASESRNGPGFPPGTPPQMPHPTLMRTNCLSCHGVFARQGVKSNHPWRQNCQQCHAASTFLDQRFRMDFIGLPK